MQLFYTYVVILRESKNTLVYTTKLLKSSRTEPRKFETASMGRLNS